jgi:hypothetical protein
VVTFFVLTGFVLPSFPDAEYVVEEWVHLYHGLDELNNAEGNAIAVSDSGNVYVGGLLRYEKDDLSDSIFLTYSVNNSGEYRWLDLSPLSTWSNYARDIVVDRSENVYVVGSVDGYFYTAKYRSTGSREWSKSPVDGVAMEVALDTSGNIYVTGKGANDIYTVKYLPNGNQLWCETYDGAGDLIDMGTAITVDLEGNAYVAGKTSGDICVIKYDTSGNEKWLRTYSGTADGSNSVRSIAVDSAGNAYITGYCTNSGTGHDLFVIKYDTDGNEEWVRTYNGTANDADGGDAIAVDSNGNAYVAGYCTNSAPYLKHDFCIIKYDTNGNQEWVEILTWTGNGPGGAEAICLDSIGDAYVAGYISTSSSHRDTCVTKYDADGNQLWIAIYGGPIDLEDSLNDIAIDHEGYIYVTGESGRSLVYDFRKDLIIIKYRQITGGMHVTGFNAFSVESGITIGWEAYVTGSYVIAGFDLYRTIGSDVLPRSGIRLNDVLITGTSPYRYDDVNVSMDVTYGYWLEVFDVGGPSEMHGPIECTWNGNLPVAYALYQSRPNPALGKATIAFDLPETGHVKLTVYDIAGREVAAPVDRELPAGTYEGEVSGLAPGVYIYRLAAGDFNAAKKMVVVE